MNGSENIDHVLRLRIAAAGIWRRIVPHALREIFFNIPFRDWLTRNLFDSTFVRSDEDWPTRFIIICWLLWKRRCSLVLAPAMGAMEDVLSVGNRLALECKQSFAARVATNRMATNPEFQATAHWNLPLRGWIKVNVDAAVSTVDGSAGVGTAIRDDKGEWLFGSTRFVGRWAIHEGLMHAWSRGYRLVELESDSLEAVRIVLVNSPEVAVFGLVLSIKRWIVKIQHVNREGNRVTDRMAAKSRTQRGLTATFSEAPADVRGLVDGEKPPSGVERVGLPEDGAIPYDPGGGINIC
ncbi:hypothetical protein V6N13_125350 [Hibiscus sabdariffa]